MLKTVLVITAVSLSLIVSLPSTGACDEAQDFYKKAIAFFEAEQYEEAAEAFRAAYSAKISWKVFFNIGQAEAAASRYGLALDAFEEYLVQGGDNVSLERREYVIGEINRLRLLVGIIELEAPEKSELIVNGITRGKVPFSGIIRVAAGMQAILVILNGKIIKEREMKIAGGVTTIIKLNEKVTKDNPNDVVPPATLDTLERPYSPVKLIIGSITGGVGLVGIGFGVGFAVKSGKIYDDYETALKDGDDDAAERLYNNDLRKADVGKVVSFVAGGIFVVAGTVLTILDVLDRKKRKEEQTSKLTLTGNGLQLSF